MQSLPLYGKIASIVTFFFAFLNLYRAIIALAQSSIQEYDGPSPTHGFLFLLEGLLQVCQVVLLLRSTRFHKMEAGIIFLTTFVCGVLLLDVRETWLAASHLLVSTLATLAVFRRQFEAKPPNYNV
ncbi:hypothetical protein B566_EDAN006153 [Ephemera danica]|nr:hypothetical protein B566_EDAN006153 [Ephemera danica]